MQREAKLILSFFLGVFLVLAAGWAQADPPGGHGPEGEAAEAGPEMMPGGGPGFISQLSLTPEQVDQLKQDKLDKRKKMIQLRAKLEELQLDLATEVEKGRPESKKIETIARQMGEVQSKMILARTQSVLFLKSILTPEQKQKWDELQLHQGGAFRGEGGRGWKKMHR